MVKYFCTGKEIVLGYGGYEKQLGFLNKLVRFDTFHVALQYLSYALIGKSYMGVGRNLAYKKSLFLKIRDLLRTFIFHLEMTIYLFEK